MDILRIVVANADLVRVSTPESGFWSWAVPITLVILAVVTGALWYLGRL